MTLDEWQSNPTLVRTAQEMMADPRMAAMLEVLSESHPVWVPQERNLSSQDLLVMHGIVKGYSMAIRTLKALSVHVSRHKEPESVFLSTDN
jgi:hypothetical protein